MYRNSQQGAVLIVSLIFLVVVTVVGLTGMEISSLEEKMAGNTRDRNIAFQAAESTLLEGEDYLKGLSSSPAFDGTSAGLYDRDADLWESINWTSSGAVRTYSGQGFSDLAASPAYIVESLEATSSDDSIGLGEPSDMQRYYRVTAHSVGQTDTAEVVLQTVYKR